MKKGIHPKFQECIVRCGCGATFKTMSTKKELNIAICSKCHPFYSGTEKLVDSAGRIERFQKKYNWGIKKEEKNN